PGSWRITSRRVAFWKRVASANAAVFETRPALTASNWIASISISFRNRREIVASKSQLITRLGLTSERLPFPMDSQSAWSARGLLALRVGGSSHLHLHRV